MFVLNITHYGMNVTQARRNAGVTSASIMDDPRIQAAILEQRNIINRRETATRGEIVRGLRDAIDQASLLGDPSAQIAGWREVAKVTDNYEPRADAPLTGKQRHVLDKLSQLSEADLIRLTEKSVHGQTINEHSLGFGEAPMEALGSESHQAGEK